MSALEELTSASSSSKGPVFVKKNDPKSMEKHLARLFKELGWQYEPNVPFKLASLKNEYCLAVDSVHDLTDDQVDDDIKRESAFSKQALDSVMKARKWFTDKKIPFTRPSDYFCEMIKSDSQMNRIRQHLLEKAASAQESEAARQRRQNRKFAKELVKQKRLEKEAEKTKGKEALAVMQKKRKRNDNNKDDGGFEDFDVELDDHAGSDNERSRGPANKRGKTVNHKREARNKKYGFGGKSNNRLAKQNDRDSTNDMEGFSQKKNKMPFGAGGGKSSAGMKKRPGKSVRAKKHGGGQQKRR